MLKFHHAITTLLKTKEKLFYDNRYKMLGNGWTVDVISHIFKNL